MWDENGTQIVWLGESANWNTPYLEIWYNITNDAGVRLKSGSYYTYQFYADFDGVRYYGPVRSFWTTGQKQNAWGSSLTMKNWTYGEKASTPTITVKYGKPQYTYSSSYYGTYTAVVPKNAGTYYVKAKVNGTNEYTGLETIKSFIISARSLKNAKVTLGESDNTYTYTGKARKPAVKSVVVGGKKLVANRDYKISYKNNKKIGTGTVVITGKGNYTGTFKKSFKIVPKKVTVSKVKSTSKKKMTVTWKKDSCVSGYQIVVATNKGFTKNKKSTTVSSYKTVKKTISSLKSKKTYYVKVRAYKTVSGKKYYGAYSSVKKVKVK